MEANLDSRTVDAFGHEWSRFDQSQLSPAELKDQFERYFRVFPWSELPANAVGFDLGCGSGRWAKLVAPRVANLHCIDASQVALEVAHKNLEHVQNIIFHHASVDLMPLEA